MKKTSREVLLVQHNFPGNMSMFELQLFSVSHNKWMAIQTSSKLDDIRAYCEKYGYTFPAEIIQCNNHK